MKLVTTYNFEDDDGDEIFTSMDSVQCCQLGWNGTTAIYSKLVPVVRYGHTYMCCDKCGGSYGELLQDNKSS